MEGLRNTSDSPMIICLTGSAGIITSTGITGFFTAGDEVFRVPPPYPSPSLSIAKEHYKSYCGHL